MSRKRESSFSPPAPDADPREWIWYRSYTELEKAVGRFGMTMQETAKLFGIKPTQVSDIFRDDKLRNPVPEVLRQLAIAKLPPDMHRPNVYYILTGDLRTPEHERDRALLEACRGRVSELEGKVQEQAEAIIRLTKNL